MNKEIFGAKAKVYIKFDGDLIELGEKLSSGLQLPEFYVKTDMDFPHKRLAMTEAFGIESTLTEVTLKGKWTHIFEFSTMHSLTESANDNMHDLSNWLARYIVDICSLDADIE